MVVALGDAVTSTCGGKAGTLGTLLRAGLPVPDGFVVPFTADLAFVREDLIRRLHALGDGPVAVRSSADDEDTARASAAGQYDTVLGVHGVGEVADAVAACRASLHSPRAVAYRDASTAGEPRMAVLVQRLLDADVSGVLLTADGPEGGTQVEASWGLGPSVVGGTVTPDAFHVAADGTVTRTLADKRTRLDRRGRTLATSAATERHRPTPDDGTALVTSAVAEPDRHRPTPDDGTALVTSAVAELDRRRPALDDATAVRLAALGRAVADVLGGVQDVEWALVDGGLWVLQARPSTTSLPDRRGRAVRADAPATLVGTPCSPGTATGTARVVRGPGDFAAVRAGDILVCPWTDPSWTPLLRLAAGVVTETGGVLSHAAIVARERRIPAVLGIAGATTTLHDATTLTVDGSAGTVTLHR